MWEKVKVAVEWDMAWFCDKCEKMESWRTKGWINSLYPNRFYCNKCKEELEKKGLR
jgi:hypothetical protein